MSVQQKQAYKDEQDFLKGKRKAVEQIEINARYQKATYETMYYALESDKLKDAYALLLEKERNEREQKEKLLKSVVQSTGDEANSETTKEAEDVQ